MTWSVVIERASEVTMVNEPLFDGRAALGLIVFAAAYLVFVMVPAYFIPALGLGFFPLAILLALLAIAGHVVVLAVKRHWVHPLRLRVFMLAEVLIAALCAGALMLSNSERLGTPIPAYLNVFLGPAFITVAIYAMLRPRLSA